MWHSGKNTGRSYRQSYVERMKTTIRSGLVAEKKRLFTSVATRWEKSLQCGF